jgi:hypothetical protein
MIPPKYTRSNGMLGRAFQKQLVQVACPHVLGYVFIPPTACAVIAILRPITTLVEALQRSFDVAQSIDPLTVGKLPPKAQPAHKKQLRCQIVCTSRLIRCLNRPSLVFDLISGRVTNFNFELNPRSGLG